MTPHASADRRAISDRYYNRDSKRFLGPPSPFAEWAAVRIRELPAAPSLLDLGSGPGRDSRYLARWASRVRAVDHSRVAIARGRAQNDNPANVRFEERDVFAALSATDPASVDVVYSHALCMMLSDAEVDTLAREVFRVLRSGGPAPLRGPVHDRSACRSGPRGRVGRLDSDPRPGADAFLPEGVPGAVHGTGLLPHRSGAGR